MNLLEGMKITTDYPAGLKPWDGRFNKGDSPAGTVVLVLSDDGREAHEYAFSFYGEDEHGGFEVVGKRIRRLVSPKRARWTPAICPFPWRPLVPFNVLKAAVDAYVAEMKVLVAKIEAERAKGASK